MLEILPIRLLTDEDAPIFGNLNVILAKLLRSGFPVGKGIVVTPPNFKLRSVLEKFDFGTKEVFKQSLTMVKKEINSIPPPPILLNETGRHKLFFLNRMKIKSVKELWIVLLNTWFDQIEQRIWNSGFSQGITDNLDPQVVIFASKMQGFGTAHFDPFQDDVAVLVKGGKLHPSDIQKIAEIVKEANKKLFLPYEYEWILNLPAGRHGGVVKLVGIKQFTPLVAATSSPIVTGSRASPCEARGFSEAKSAVKVFFELSTVGLTAEKDIDGIYIASEKIFDLDKPSESFENLVLKVVESAIAFPNSPILFKLADQQAVTYGYKSEGMGKVRGALRLIHQKSLFDPLLEALDFARLKKGLTNVHIVVPFVRGVNELLKIKRELVVRKLSRKNSLQIWMEAAVPENILNLEDYLAAGIDGVVLNLDELIAYLNGFDHLESELAFYKSEVDGLIKFLEDGIRVLHKSKTPFITYGNLTFNPKVLEFLVEKGVWGVVVERYEAHSAKDLLYQVEKRMVLRKTV